MPSISYESFQGGELDPKLHAQRQLPQRLTGVKTLRNMYVDRHGSASNRYGWKYNAEAKDSSAKTRCIEFVLNKSISFVLEFGNNYMRVYDSGVVTDYGSLSAYSAGATYDNGDMVSSSGVNYWSRIDNNKGLTPADHPAAWYAMPTGILEAYTPWVTADLFDLEYVQSGNTMTVTDQGNGYRVVDIVRVSDTQWQVKEKTFATGVIVPTNCNATKGGAGSNTYRYTVTAVDVDGKESLPAVGQHAGGQIHGISQINGAKVLFSSVHSLGLDDMVYVTGVEAAQLMNDRIFRIKAIDSTTLITLDVDASTYPATGSSATITAATQANPVVVTATDHGFSNGDTVYIYGSDMTEINNKTFTVANVSGDDFELSGVNGTGYTAAGTIGTVCLSEFTTTSAVVGVVGDEETSAAAPSTGAPHVVTWTGSAGTNIASYNVYKLENGFFGFIGAIAASFPAASETFSDTGIDADTSITPPLTTDWIYATGDLPACVGYYQQRLILGNGTDNVERITCSRTGDTNNLTKANKTSTDGDAFRFSLLGRRVSPIRHLLDLGRLIVMTEGGSWIANGDQNGSMIPTAINAQAINYYGSDKLQPIVVGNRALYIQILSGAIRDLGYDFESDGYIGEDLNHNAGHLFKGRTVVDWAYQERPDSIVWMCLDNGDLIGMTYIPERKIVAFHHHDSVGGVVESLCSLPEDGEYKVYAFIKRTVDGSTVRYLESMKERSVTSLKTDAIFLDSYLTQDGRNTAATTMTLTSGGSYSALTAMTLASSVSYFVAGDVDSTILLRVSSTVFNNDTGKNVTTVTEIPCVISAYASGTSVTAIPQIDVPAGLQATAVTNWGHAKNTVSGLDHLEGETVYGIGDGNFIESMTVASGVVTIPNSKYYEVIHIGLLYYSDLETLDIESVQGDSLVDAYFSVNTITAQMVDTESFHIGADGYSNLTKYDVPNTDDETYLGKDPTECIIKSDWNNHGRIFIRMKEAKPITITGVKLSGYIETTEGE